MAFFIASGAAWSNVEVEHVKLDGTVRNVHIGKIDPSAADGVDGDIFIKVS